MEKLNKSRIILGESKYKVLTKYWNETFEKKDISNKYRNGPFEEKDNVVRWKGHSIQGKNYYKNKNIKRIKITKFWNFFF